MMFFQEPQHRRCYIRGPGGSKVVPAGISLKAFEKLKWTVRSALEVLVENADILTYRCSGRLEKML